MNDTTVAEWEKKNNKQTNTLLSTNLYFSSYVCVKWMKRENEKKNYYV